MLNALPWHIALPWRQNMVKRGCKRRRRPSGSLASLYLRSRWKEHRTFSLMHPPRSRARLAGRSEMMALAIVPVCAVHHTVSYRSASYRPFHGRGSEFGTRVPHDERGPPWSRAGHTRQGDAAAAVLLLPVRHGGPEW
jgi:hypothetical protein